MTRGGVTGILHIISKEEYATLDYAGLLWFSEDQYYSFVDLPVHDLRPLVSDEERINSVRKPMLKIGYCRTCLLDEKVRNRQPVVSIQNALKHRSRMKRGVLSSSDMAKFRKHSNDK